MAIGTSPPDNPFSEDAYQTPASVSQRIFSSVGSTLTGEALAINRASEAEDIENDKAQGVSRPEDNMLPPNEIEKQYGFKTDGPMTPKSAEGMAQQLDIAQQTAAKYRGAGWIGRNGPQLIAGFADPTNVALAFMPEIGLASKLAGLIGGEAPGIIARTASRALVGGAEATIVNAPAMAIQADIAQSEGHEFSRSDWLRNLGISFAMGTVIHPITGAIGDAIKPMAESLRDTPVDNRVNALRSSLGSILKDEPIDPTPVFEQGALARDKPADSFMASKEFKFEGNKQASVFNEETPKPVQTDYSTLKPEDLKGAVKEIFDEETAKRQPESQTPKTPVTEPKLPRELAGVKPRYKGETPQFESDIDKALYIVGNDVKKSTRDADYRGFLKENGYDDTSIAQGSKQIKDHVKETAKSAEPGELKIEKQNGRKSEEPAAVAEKPATTVTTAGVNKIELRKAMNEAGVRMSDGPDVAAQKLLARTEQIKTASQVDARSHMDAYMNHLKTMREEGTIMGSSQEEVRNYKDASDESAKEIKKNPEADIEKLNKLNADFEQLYAEHAGQPEYQEIMKIKEEAQIYEKAVKAAAQCLGRA